MSQEKKNKEVPVAGTSRSTRAKVKQSQESELTRDARLGKERIFWGENKANELKETVLEEGIDVWKTRHFKRFFDHVQEHDLMRNGMMKIRTGDKNIFTSQDIEAALKKQMITVYGVMGCEAEKRKTDAYYLTQRDKVVGGITAHAFLKNTKQEAEELATSNVNIEDPIEALSQFWAGFCDRPARYANSILGTLMDDHAEQWHFEKLNTLINELDSAGVGLTSSYLYAGCVFSAFPVHEEDKRLYSINFQYHGASKFWFFIYPESVSEALRQIAKWYADVEEYTGCTGSYKHKNYMFHPRAFDTNVKWGWIEQRPGDIIITAPGVIHWGFSSNFNEAVNFAHASWISTGLLSQVDICDAYTDPSRKYNPSMFAAVQKYLSKEDYEMYVNERLMIKDSLDNNKQSLAVYCSFKNYDDCIKSLVENKLGNDKNLQKRKAQLGFAIKAISDFAYTSEKRQAYLYDNLFMILQHVNKAHDLTCNLWLMHMIIGMTQMSSEHFGKEGLSYSHGMIIATIRTTLGQIDEGVNSDLRDEASYAVIRALGNVVELVPKWEEMVTGHSSMLKKAKRLMINISKLEECCVHPWRRGTIEECIERAMSPSELKSQLAAIDVAHMLNYEDSSRTTAQYMREHRGVVTKLVSINTGVGKTVMMMALEKANFNLEEQELVMNDEQGGNEEGELETGVEGGEQMMPRDDDGQGEAEGRQVVVEEVEIEGEGDGERGEVDGNEFAVEVGMDGGQGVGGPVGRLPGANWDYDLGPPCWKTDLADQVVRAEGLNLRWVSLEEAIELMNQARNCTPDKFVMTELQLARHREERRHLVEIDKRNRGKEKITWTYTSVKGVRHDDDYYFIRGHNYCGRCHHYSCIDNGIKAHHRSHSNRGTDCLVSQLHHYYLNFHIEPSIRPKTAFRGHR